MELFENFISAISQIIREPEQRLLSVAPSPYDITQHYLRNNTCRESRSQEKALEVLTCHGSTR